MTTIRGSGVVAAPRAVRGTRSQTRPGDARPPGAWSRP
jgi:hypothetical protein